MPVGALLAHHPPEGGNFRSAFAGFDFERVARFGPKDVERLLQDAGIVRHRVKIEATFILRAPRWGWDGRGVV